MSDLSTEAESVGVYKAKVLLLKIKLEKEIRTKNIPRNFSSHLNHPPPVSLCGLRFLVLHIILFYHKKNSFFNIKKENAAYLSSEYYLKKNVVLPF